MVYFHQPVLVKEVLEYLNLKPNDNVIDGTVGGGGHAEAILKKIGPNGHLLGLDRDPKAIAAAQQRLIRFKNRFTLIQDSYKNLPSIINNYFRVKRNKNKNIYAERSGIQFNHLLLDLGLSSAQVAPKDERGFSFQNDSPLDMRFGPDSFLTAGEILNKWSKDELIKIFKEYGEERYAKKIAEKIVLSRQKKPIKTTLDLVEIIDYRQRGRIHPATKVFQALRIAVNDELNVLKESLPSILDILSPAGRIAVISYHSLEDRIVKRFFQKEAKDCLCPKNIPICQCHHQARLKIITKKPIVPKFEEIEQNPRSRSAKLRVAEKVVSRES